MSLSFVANITFTSNTYEGTQRFSSPLLLDQSRYNYFIKILNVRYSANWSNITAPLKLIVDGTTLFTLQIGIYEVSDIASLVNAAQNKVKLELNNNNGHMSITNLTANSIVITGNLMSSIQMGVFNSSLTLTASETTTSPQICAVSNFNLLKLQSDTIGVCSLESSANSEVLNYTSTLYTFSASAAPFAFKDYVSFEPILYELSQDQLNELSFKIVDEHGNKLSLLPGSKSDFSIQAVIVRSKK